MPLTRVQSALGFALPFLFSVLLVRLIVSTAGPGGLFGAAQGPVNVTFSAVIDVSQKPGNESDMVFAFSPADPLKGVAGYTVFGTSASPMGVELKATVTGGTDWFVLPPLPPGQDTDGTHFPFAQPAVAADASGRFLVTYMAGGSSGISIWVAVLKDDFTLDGVPLRLTPVPPTPPSFDLFSNPQLAIGPSGVPGQEAACVAFNGESGLASTGIHVACAPLTGGTLTFTNKKIPGSDQGWQPDLAFDGQDGIVVTFLKPGQSAGTSDILFSRDPDGLGSADFEPAHVITTTNVDFPDSIPASPPPGGITAGPRLAVDMARKRTLVAFTDKKAIGSFDSDVFVMRSDDNVTFTARVQVNDDATTASQFLPAVAVDQKTGHAAVAFLDARNDPQNTAVQLFVGISTNGASTWDNVQAAPDASRIAAHTPSPPHGFGRRQTIRFDGGKIDIGFAANSPGLAGNPDSNLEAVMLFGSVTPTAGPVVKRFVATGAGSGGGSHVRFFDAESGAETASFFAFTQGFTGGARPTVLQNVTGTAAPIVVVGAGAGGGPQISLFDADTGQPTGPLVSAWPRAGLPSAFLAFDPGFRGGVFVAAGDVDCDGTMDVIAGAGETGGPEVRVFAGATGALVRSFFAYDPAFRGGVRVAAGDVNGDGCADIVTGPGPGGGPHIKVFSGKNGALLYSFFAFDPGFTGGVWVAVGDVNGDGRADIIVGADAGGGPHVKVFSGLDGSLLHSFFAYDAGFTGGVRVAAVDVNGDGRADIVTGAGPGGGPEVAIFDGVTLAVIRRFFAYDPAFRGGVFVAGGPP